MSSQEIILWIIAVLAIIGLIGYLFKVAIKTIILICALYLIFNIAFVWTGANLQRLQLDRYIGKTAASQVVHFFDLFTKKRDTSNWIDPNLLEQKVKEETLKKAKQGLNMANQIIQGEEKRKKE